MRIALSVLSLLAGVAAGPLAAQDAPRPAPAAAPAPELPPEPTPIAEWSHAKISAMGREIYVQDRASWVATDALLAALDDADARTIRGWVVLGDGATRRVRFLRAEGDAVVPGWDVVVTDGVAGAVTPASETALDGETLSRFTARQTAAQNIGALRCGQYNSVVAPDPDGDGWLVWLLASSREAGVMPVGGHYRFRVSADGRTVVSRDQLSNTCLSMQADPPPGPQGQVAAIVVSQMARETRADAVVLEATTPTARAAVDQMVGLWRPLVRIDLAPGLATIDIPASLADFPGRVVVLEAGRDRTLPPALSRRLARDLEARAARVRRLVFPDAGHGDIADQPDFVRRVGEALAV